MELELYAIATSIEIKEIDKDVGLVFDLKRELAYTLNGTGLFILAHIQKKNDLPKIIFGFSKKFKVPVKKAKLDVSAFLNELKSKRILVKL